MVPMGIWFINSFLRCRTKEQMNTAGHLKIELVCSVRSCLPIRAVIPTEMPLFLRISATDWAGGGWDLAESVRLAQELRLLGVDLIDVSSGGLVHDANIKPFPGYQVELAREIREQAGIHVTTVGLITEPEHAEEILRNNDADAVMLGRALLRNPRWALNAAESLGYECRWPQQLQRARTINPRKSPQ